MKIVTAFLKYDYGIKSRGVSLEKSLILPAIKKNTESIVPFWLEENGFPDNQNKLQYNLIEFVKEEKPELVFFILMNDEIQIDTIKKLNEISNTVNWFSDDQWRFDNFSKRIGPHLTYIITVDKFSVDKYKTIGCENVILTQWSTAIFNKKLNLNSVEFKYDVSFVGGKNLTREWYIYELAKKGIIVDCFGDGWEVGRLSLEEMNQVFLKSKISLNLSNSIPKDIRYYRFIKKQLFIILFKGMKLKKKIRMLLGIMLTLLGRNGLKDVEQIKARNFEIPGSGGFELSQYAPEIEDFYNIGKEIAIFTSPDELKRQIEYYLNNDSTRNEMRNRAFFRTQNYTYNNRIKKIFEELII